MTIPVMLLALVPIAACAGAASADDLNFDLANNSDLELLEVFIWPSEVRESRNEMLFGQTLQPGEVVEMTIENRRGICDYNLLFLLSDGQTIEDTADLCDTDVLALQP